MLLFGLLGCQGTSKTTVRTQATQSKKENTLRIQDYFPLRVGDKWTYNIQYSFTKKIKQWQVRMVRKKGRLFYDSDKPPQQYEYDAYGLRTQKVLDGQKNYEWCKRKEFGLCAQRRYLLKYPLEVGNRWMSVIGVTKVERYMIMSVSHTVRTPAGAYDNCIVVRSREDQGRLGILENRLYFAPQVGLIKIVTVKETRAGRRIPQWTLELISYYTQK